MPESQQFPALEISTEIALIYKRHYGRGPTRIAVHLVGDAVVCLLEDVNVPAQAALIERGRTDVARTIHEELQLGMADAMTEVVERHLGRAVRVYVPGFNAGAGAATDTFYLEPEEDAPA